MKWQMTDSGPMLSILNFPMDINLDREREREREAVMLVHWTSGSSIRLSSMTEIDMWSVMIYITCWIF